MIKYNRILLKLSGEALMDQQQSISAEKLILYIDQIKELAELGVEVGIVIGGGNIFRGLKNNNTGIDRVNGDYMGMLATVINSIGLKSSLQQNGLNAKVLTATRMEPIADFYSRSKALRALSSKTIVIFSGGTGNPFFTTDTAASLRAVEINADVLIKGTDVDGIYSDDPKKNPKATKIDSLNFDDAINKNLKVMDMTAFTMCKENKLPIIVCNINKQGILKDLVLGKNAGTIVSPV
jgi:uridylate kinase